MIFADSQNFISNSNMKSGTTYQNVSCVLLMQGLWQKIKTIIVTKEKSSSFPDRKIMFKCSETAKQHPFCYQQFPNKYC